MWRDESPKHADGTAFDGQHLMTLMHNGASPFENLWDVNLLLQEIETRLGAKVVDIPMSSQGSNNYVRSSIISYKVSKLMSKGFSPCFVRWVKHRCSSGAQRCKCTGV